MHPVVEKMDSEAKAFFDALPPVLQEQIMQGGGEMTTKAQLESYYANVLHKEK